MKIALLGTGFGQVHAGVYAQRRDVDEVVVFGRTPDKLDKISTEFGFATSTRAVMIAIEAQAGASFKATPLT
jgi:predicted dehydrogenase